MGLVSPSCPEPCRRRLEEEQDLLFIFDDWIWVLRVGRACWVSLSARYGESCESGGLKAVAHLADQIYASSVPVGGHRCQGSAICRWGGR